MNIVIRTKQWKIAEVAAKLEAFAIANRDVSSEFYVHLYSLLFTPFTEVYSNSTQRIGLLKSEVRIIIRDALGMDSLAVFSRPSLALLSRITTYS
jgi:hypothetical protein